MQVRAFEIYIPLINIPYSLVPIYPKFNELRLEIFNNVVCATSKGSDQPAQTRSLIRAFAGR